MKLITNIFAVIFMFGVLPLNYMCARHLLPPDMLLLLIFMMAIPMLVSGLIFELVKDKPKREYNIRRTPFTRYVEERLKSPEARKAYDEMTKELKEKGLIK